MVARLAAMEQSEQSRRTIETFFRRLTGGEDVNDMFAEPVDHYVPGAEVVPWTGRRSTRPEVAEFFDMLRTHLEPRDFALSQLIVGGEDAVALGRFAYTVRSTRRPFEGQFALHLTVKDDQITRYHMYEDSYALERAFTCR